MTANENFDRLISSWIADGPERLSDAAVDRFLTDFNAPTTRMPAWLLRRNLRRIHVNRFAQAVVGAAAVVVTAVLALNLIAGQQGRLGGPLASPTSSAPVVVGASPTPDPTPQATAAPPGPTPDGSTVPGHSPSPSGASGALAYDVDGDIFLADADGSNAVRIADGEPRSSSECTPGEVSNHYAGTSWSPDGRHLAYWNWQPCTAAPDYWGDVVIADANGNVIASFYGEGWAIPWSPDSTRIAVLDNWGGSVIHRQDLTIGVYTTDGTRQTTLTVPSELAPSSGDYSAAWSLDGSSILVPGALVPLDGGLATPSDESGFYSGCCVYSPDGTRRGVVDKGTLVVEESDGPNSQKVGPTEFWSLAWSPDGALIAFESSINTDTGSAAELLVRDVATGADTSLFDVPGSDDLQVLEFTPDGERVLFIWWDGEQKSLWSVGADGSDPRRLVDGIEGADLRPQPGS